VFIFVFEEKAFSDIGCISFYIEKADL